MPIDKDDPAPSLDKKALTLPASFADDEGMLIELNQEINLAAEGSRLTGMFQAYRQMSRLTKLQETYLLSKIRESKAFHRQVYVDEGGNRIRTKTWALYCKHVVRRPRSCVDEDIANLRALGVEVFQTAEKAGIPMSKLTGIRLLSDASLEGVLEQIKNSGEDHDEVREIMRAAIEQHEFEKAEIQIKLDGAQADIKAKNRVIEDKSKLLDEKNRELDEQRLINDRVTLTKEQKKDALRQEVLNRQGAAICAIGAFEDAIIQLYEGDAATAATMDIHKAQFNALFEDLEMRRGRQGFGSHRQFYSLEPIPEFIPAEEPDDSPGRPSSESSFKILTGNFAKDKDPES